jgi:hypothetical protein
MRTETNRIDTELQMKFFRAHGLLDAQGQPGVTAKLLVEIERIADRVDRAKSPVTTEEFNRPMFSAARWLDTPREKAIATEMEQDWEYYTRGASYEEFRRRRLGNPIGIIRSACSEAFGKLQRKAKSLPPLDAATH